jgi:hypothetical protein
MTDLKHVAFNVYQATASAAVLDLSGKLITQAVFQTEASAIRGKMLKTEPQGSERSRGWPSKKVMTGGSRGVFSLDFLFIEQAVAAASAGAVLIVSLNAVHGPAERER